MKEVEIQRQICDYLALKKHLFYRNNNVPIYDPSRNVFRAMPKFTMKGLPDLIVIQPPHGTYLGMEIKQEGKKLSGNQAEFQAKLERVGGRYHLVRSLDDVIALGL